MSVTVRNPHSVAAALECRPQDVLQLTIPRSSGDAWDRVRAIARKSGVAVSESSKKPQRNEIGRESGAEAVIRERDGIPVEQLFGDAPARRNGKGLWLALDCLTDPHNVGAIFRTASFFGIEGILLTQERSAPLSATVYDVASGGIEYVPFTLQTNLQRAFEVAKDSGLWILGTSEHANDDIKSVAVDRPWLLVLGNEERGMRRLTQESCDVLCRISGPGQVQSLNVSVAAGVMMAHFAR